MKKTRPSNNFKDVTIKDVLKIYWQALKTRKFLFFFAITSSLVSSILWLLVPIFYKKFFDIISIDNIDRISFYGDLVNLILIILILHVVAEIINRSGMFSLNIIGGKSMALIKQNAFDYLMKHSHSFFINNFSGALVQKVSRLYRSFDRLIDLIFFEIIPLCITLGGTILIVYFYQPVISIIMIIWVICIIIVNTIFSKWKLKYDLLATEADSKTTAVLADSISNYSAVNLFANLDNESDNFKKVSDNQASAQILSWNMSNIFYSTQGLLMMVAEFFVFYYALKLWKDGLLSIGTFILFQSYILSISYRMWGFGNLIKGIYESFADSKEMVVILKTPHEIQDAIDARELNVERGGIEFHKISFNFNNENSLINDFSLSIGGGEKVAFIGPSGAGKSTLVKLILRTYDVSSGSIKVDGQDIKEVTQESLHKNISFVPQEPVLFHRTLMENIRYGRPEASDEEVIKAAKLAHCDEFIDKLPLKYETLVGERGIKLSGGERQRVAIARAMLKNAPILVLDEATSSLDSHSEALIQDALDKLMVGKTTIVIAHRLSTIRKMDRIVVIEAGKVREDGSHDKLLENKDSLYKKLWNLQAGGFIAG